jgi:hypothetical protein
VGIVVIPFGYESLPPSQQDGVVPICIEARDRHGNLIAPVWFEEGVAPIHKRIVKHAAARLNDPWLASELTERSVHTLWYRHGPDGGRAPSSRVWAQIVWDLRDMEVGGDWRYRTFRLVSKTLEEFDRHLTSSRVDTPECLEEEYERRLLLDRIETTLKANGLDEIAQIYRLLLLGNTWAEVAEGLGYGTEESLKKRFHRAIRKVFRVPA